MQIKNFGELRLEAKPTGVLLSIVPEADANGNGKLLPPKDYRIMIPFKKAFELYEAVNGESKGFIQKTGNQWLTIRYLTPLEKEKNSKKITLYDGIGIWVYDEYPLRKKDENKAPPAVAWRFFIRGGKYLELKKILKNILRNVEHLVVRIDNNITLIRTKDVVTVYYGNRDYTFKDKSLEALKSDLMDLVLSTKGQALISRMNITREQAKEMLRYLV